MTHLKKNDVGRAPASKLLSRNYTQLHPRRRRFFSTLPLFPGSLRPSTHSRVSAELFWKRKLSAGSVAVRLAALEVDFKTLKKSWNIVETPYPKKDHRLPTILSQEEVARLIQAAGTSFHRTSTTLYATGARVPPAYAPEVQRLRQAAHGRSLQGGKGRIPRRDAQF